MQRLAQFDDPTYADAIDREIAVIRETGALGRSSNIRDLFDYLVLRSRQGCPPREVEIAQDVFGRVGQTADDGAGRVYIHRLRRRLEEMYEARPEAELRIALPLGEYRLVADLPDLELAEPAAVDVDDAAVVQIDGEGFSLFGPDRRGGLVSISRFLPLVVAALGGALIAALIFMLGAPERGAIWRDAAHARRSALWGSLFANGRDVIVVVGDEYLFEQRTTGGVSNRLISDPRIRSREDLDNFILAHPSEAGKYFDADRTYVPTTVPRAQLYLSPLLLAAPSVRALPASQLPASAMLSQNIVYLGLGTGLGPLSAPVSSGSRFQFEDEDSIRDRRSGKVYRGTPIGADPSAPRRQYGLLSTFSGKEGNRYVVLAGTSGMGLVGLVETVADPQHVDDLLRRTHGALASEAVYQVDSQGAGVLAVHLVVAAARDQTRVWTP